MDKKLTDSEIVKALKEILEIMLTMGDLQKSATISKAIDLINRLQAENKELKKELAKPILATKDLKVSFERIYRIGEEKALVQALKAEAYEEFIDKFLEKAISTRNYFEIKSLARTVLNELVGEDNGNAK
jgi:hypothetical protein